VRGGAQPRRRSGGADPNMHDMRYLFSDLRGFSEARGFITFPTMAGHGGDGP
jgi:hypothetical protein